MKKFIVLLAIIALSLAIYLPLSVEGQDQDQNQTVRERPANAPNPSPKRETKFRRAENGKGVKDEYIVVFNETVADPDTASGNIIAVHGGYRKHIYRRALKGFSINVSEKKAQRIA